MTNKTSKNIRICCFVALALCLVWAVSMVANIAVNMFGNEAASHLVDWSQNTIMKVVVVFCYVAGTIAMIGLCAKIVINIMKELREGICFPRSNEKLLFWLALADFVYRLSWGNIPVLFQEDFVFCFSGPNLIMPFLLLFFAFMYKVAADAVEENNLTV